MSVDNPMVMLDADTAVELSDMTPGRIRRRIAHAATITDDDAELAAELRYWAHELAAADAR